MKQKIMHPEFSSVFHRKIGQIYFSISYRKDATETEYAAFVSNEFVTASTVDHGVGLEDAEIQEAILAQLQQRHAFKKYVAYVIEKLQTEYHAEETEKTQKLRRVQHRIEMLQKKAAKVSPYYEVKIPAMMLPQGAYGLLDQPASGSQVLLKRGTKLLVADSTGIRFYDNCPLPPLPIKKSAVELGEVIIHKGKWKQGELINFMPEIRELMGDFELRVTDLVPKVTVVVPVVLPVRNDDEMDQVENKARKFLKCPEPSDEDSLEDIKDADIFDAELKKELSDEQIKALIEDDEEEESGLAA